MTRQTPFTNEEISTARMPPDFVSDCVRLGIILDDVMKQKQLIDYVVDFMMTAVGPQAMESFSKLVEVPLEDIWDMLEGEKPIEMSSLHAMGGKLGWIPTTKASELLKDIPSLYKAVSNP